MLPVTPPGNRAHHSPQSAPPEALPTSLEYRARYPFVARGAARLAGVDRDLGEGDAVRLEAAGSLSLTAAAERTEIVIWETA